jgi:hypothetical protein
MLEPLTQSYQRLEELLYRYESEIGSFVADLRVIPVGFLFDYPGMWMLEGEAQAANFRLKCSCMK